MVTSKPLGSPRKSFLSKGHLIALRQVDSSTSSPPWEQMPSDPALPRGLSASLHILAPLQEGDPGESSFVSRALFGLCCPSRSSGDVWVGLQVPPGHRFIPPPSPPPPPQVKQTESGLETAVLAPSAHHSCPPWPGSRGKHITPMSASQVEQDAQPQVPCSWSAPPL